MSPTAPHINFKKEAWKYTPKAKFDWSNFQFKDNEVSNFKSTAIGIGPSERQFEKIFIEDLIKDEVLDVKQSKPTTFYKRPYVQNAHLDQSLKLYHDSLKAIDVNFHKAFPSFGWFNLNHFSPKVKLYPKGDNCFCFFESGSEESDTSSIVNIYAEEESHLDIGLSLDGKQSTYRQMNIFLKDRSSVNLFSLLSGPALYKRLEVRVFCEGESTQVTLNGLSHTKARNTFEFHSDVFHVEKNQKIKQIYKTLNEESGHSIFKGRVHLTKESDEADVEQLNQNLLLGEKSKVDTQPELNIEHDNLKASHGATTGTLDTNHFFYMRSRGFSESQARALLLKGFALEPLLDLKNSGFYEFFRQKITGGEI